jgi:5-methylcytosine-specific restriction endonuclease McrA
MWEGDLWQFCETFGLTPKQARRHQCTAEHLRARSDGGTDSADNIVAACRFCNEQRHRAKDPLQPCNFKVKVKKRLAGGRWHGFIPVPSVLLSVPWDFSLS